MGTIALTIVIGLGSVAYHTFHCLPVSFFLGALRSKPSKCQGLLRPSPRIVCHQSDSEYRWYSVWSRARCTALFYGQEYENEQSAEDRGFHFPWSRRLVSFIFRGHREWEQYELNFLRCRSAISPFIRAFYLRDMIMKTYDITCKLHYLVIWVSPCSKKLIILAFLKIMPAPYSYSGQLKVQSQSRLSALLNCGPSYNRFVSKIELPSRRRRWKDPIPLAKRDDDGRSIPHSGYRTLKWLSILKKLTPIRRGRTRIFLWNFKDKQGHIS